jgi:nucleotide-binding universal stress UspA family protein
MEIEANRAAAEELFKRLAAKHNFDLIDQPELGAMRTARWVFMAGSVDSLFASHGRISDLTLVTRPQPDAKGIGGDFMLAALIESGKPVIVLPQSPANSLGKRILIAWNQSVEAARAVTASLPLLQQAESVYIVSAGPESKRGPKAASLASHLNYWNVNAVCRRTKGRDAAQGILDVFHKEGADLLVMGAYSRGRIRETVFGGVTEDLLMGSPLPVFALHS